MVKKPASYKQQNDLEISSPNRKRKYDEIEKDENVQDEELKSSKRSLKSEAKSTCIVHQFSLELLKEKLEKLDSIGQNIIHPNFSKTNSWLMKDFNINIDWIWKSK